MSNTTVVTKKNLFRYSVCSPLRLLIPCTGALFAIPIFLKKELMNYYSLPVFYFFGSYFFFINFPIIGEILHGKPTYIEDLVLSSSHDGDIDDHSFKKIYSVLMNFILAVLFAVFAEYIIIQGIRDKSVIEVLGIIGGNWSIYMKAADTFGKILLNICYCMKSKEVRRRLSETGQKL